MLDLPFFYDMAFINNNGDYLRGKLLIGQYLMSCFCIKEGLWMTQNNWKVPLLHSFDIDLPLGNKITIGSVLHPGHNIQSTGTDTMNFQGFNLILLNNIQRWNCQTNGGLLVFAKNLWEQVIYETLSITDRQTKQQISSLVA